MNKPGVREHLFGTLVQCLGEGGLAERDGLTAQPGQADYAQRWTETIVRALDGRADGDTRAHLLMSGADTGTGKTIGYALPALTAAAMGHRVAIATNSHQLQRQMLGQNGFEGDLPRVAKWLHALGHGSLTFAQRVGRQAFVSAAAVELVLSSLYDEPAGTVSAEELKQVHELHDWALESNRGRNSGLISDAQEQFGGRLPAGLSAEAIALDADCPAADHAAYGAHLEAAERADVVLMTHQYLASCAMFRGGRLSERGFTLLLIDEADLLRDAADKCFRFNLSLARLVNLLQLAPGKAAKNAAEIASEVLQLAAAAAPRGTQSALAMDAMPAATRSQLADGIERLAKAIKAVPISKQADDELGESLGEASAFLARLGRLEPGQLFTSAISWSPTRQLPSMCMLPQNPGVLLRTIWHRDRDVQAGGQREDIAAVLFTSATLGTPGNAWQPVDRFRDIARALGVPTASNDRVDLAPELCSS